MVEVIARTSVYHSWVEHPERTNAPLFLSFVAHGSTATPPPTSITPCPPSDVIDISIAIARTPYPTGDSTIHDCRIGEGDGRGTTYIIR